MKSGVYCSKKWIVGVSLLVFMAVFFIVGIQGKAQDRENLNSYFVYQEALANYQAGDYEQAFAVFQSLLSQPQYQDSITLNWDVGRVEFHRMNYSEAISYFERVKEVYPAILLEPIFIEEYAYVLSQVDSAKALKYLEFLAVKSSTDKEVDD